ncbi:unnamed protein product [Adineta steineri]|uniref:Methyltransferase type 11 domain-containing protein n=2 Tax=Adineta steineri TaxID=433720 RepID=A0A819PU03_9BILA|nr:unnamed protein product [Adineta steineri]CAF3562742.1 unnamed protein product [Adineta steineri]CAF4014499.1 unnamed protein product [Adineta steineri]
MADPNMNVVAAEGFEKAAEVYEQARPTYPADAIQFIKSLHDKPNVIVDLGAGTGKLTRLLGSMGAQEIVAIEPVAAMRENLKKIPIITKIIDGTAEHIPFDDSSIDIIICAQAFHWFANHRALTELNRVLKSNGLLILIWNNSDNQGIEWADNITKYVDSFKPKDVSRYKSMEWKAVFDNQNLFSSLQQKQFSHKQRVTRDLVLNRILSTSFVAALSSEEQTKLVDNVKKMLNDIEEIRNVNEFDITHRTDVYWCSPLKSSS